MSWRCACSLRGSSCTQARARAMACVGLLCAVSPRVVLASPSAAASASFSALSCRRRRRWRAESSHARSSSDASASTPASLSSSQRLALPAARAASSAAASSVATCACEGSTAKCSEPTSSSPPKRWFNRCTSVRRLLRACCSGDCGQSISAARRRSSGPSSPAMASSSAALPVDSNALPSARVSRTRAPSAICAEACAATAATGVTSRPSGTARPGRQRAASG